MAAGEGVSLGEGEKRASWLCVLRRAQKAVGAPSNAYRPGYSPQEVLHAREKVSLRNEDFFARGERFHFHLRPFVAEKQCRSCPERFGGLKLLSNFRGRERIVDAPTSLAQLLQPLERVGTPFFLCDDEINVERVFTPNEVGDPCARGRHVLDHFAENDIPERKADGGQRDRAVAELMDEIVVAAATGDGAEFS